jgi:hypothetical protein
MSSEIILCPACGRQVRVPESLLGQAVRCPECKVYFKSPICDAEGRLGTSELMPDPAASLHYRQETGKRPGMSEAPTFVPALFLLLVGITGLGANGFLSVVFVTDPDRGIEAIKEGAKITKMEVSDDDAKRGVEIYRIVFPVGAACNLISLLGAISMMRMRMWSLGVVGSVVAMFNLASLCCLIGLPTGIFCLIKLFDPDTRALFGRTVDSSSRMNQP